MANTTVASHYEGANAKKVSDIYSGQPVMFQEFNDQRQELQSFLILQTERDKRTVFFLNPENKNVESKSFNDLMYKGSQPACQNSEQIRMKYLNNAKASSTIDINGDCIPDLILETLDAGTNDKPNLEIYLATPNGFCLVAIQALDDDYLMASFADFSSGTLPR